MVHLWTLIIHGKSRRLILFVLQVKLFKIKYLEGNTYLHVNEEAFLVLKAHEHCSKLWDGLRLQGVSAF